MCLLRRLLKALRRKPSKVIADVFFDTILHLLKQSALICFQRQTIISFAINNLIGDRNLSPHRINGDDASKQTFSAFVILRAVVRLGFLVFHKDQSVNLKLIIHEILEDYVLPIHGDHGVSHWARVLENGRRLSETTGANLTVVSLFAVFHDSRRINECTDHDHGLRGADFAAEQRDRLFEISDHEFNLLYQACEGHTHGRTHPDITIQTCWDSDRLDLGRVGITPHPSKLCTDAAKTKEMIQWADGRASFHIVPKFILDDWAIKIPKERIW